MREAGIVADCVDSAEAAVEKARENSYTIFVLDVHLPGQTGMELLKSMRAANSSVPVLLISAKGEVDDRVSGLDAGADDFLSKPFEMVELIARVRALERREAGKTAPLLKVGNLSLNRITRQISRDSHSIELTAREFRLLEYLMNATGKACSRDEILRNVWDYSFDPGTNVVDVCIRRLRDKIDLPGQSPLLHSVRGVGYVLEQR